MFSNDHVETYCDVNEFGRCKWHLRNIVTGFFSKNHALNSIRSPTRATYGYG